MKRDEADELCRMVLALCRAVKAKQRQEPARVDCPGYDELVAQGRLQG